MYDNNGKMHLQWRRLALRFLNQRLSLAPLLFHLSARLYSRSASEFFFSMHHKLVYQAWPRSVHVVSREIYVNSACKVEELAHTLLARHLS